MNHLDRIIGIGAVVLGLMSMAVILSTDAYSTGARVDARGYAALNHLINDGKSLCLNQAAPAAPNAETTTQ